MKSAIVLFLSLIAIVANGQTETPFKGANRIVFECADSTDNLYKRLGQHLGLKGYSLIADKDFLTINTKEREASNNWCTYVINSIVQKNRIVFTIHMYFNRIANAPTSWDWVYSNAQSNKIMYGDFMKAMEGFERLKIYYEKY